MGKAIRIFCLALMMIASATVVNAAAFTYGDQGAEVEQLQAALAAMGYRVEADGSYGQATANAVKQFQAAHGLEVDGLVGAMTYRALMGRDIPEVSRGGYIERRIVSSALQYIGVPYSFGGTTPSGFDCSGYVRYVFANAGVYLPRTADSQFECGYAVSYSNLQVGDLVFFSTYEPGPSHVGIYLGNGSFISASSSNGVIVDSLSSSYWGSCYIGARRVL